jgi:hypothetical protein
VVDPKYWREPLTRKIAETLSMIDLNNPRDWDKVKLGVNFEFRSSGKGSWFWIRERQKYAGWVYERAQSSTCSTKFGISTGREAMGLFSSHHENSEFEYKTN